MTIGTIVDGIIARRGGAWAHASWWNVLIILPWTIGLVVMLYQWRTDVHTAERQRTTSGVITAHEAANHNQFRYEFQVEGKRYTGLEAPRVRELGLGKQVTVFYDPINPNKNALTDFHELSLESIGPIPVILLGIGGVAAFIFYARRSATGAMP